MRRGTPSGWTIGAPSHASEMRAQAVFFAVAGGLLSTLATLIYAPGICITDSAQRALLAAHFAEGLAVPDWVTTAWFPPAMSEAMAWSWSVARSFTPFLAAQVFLACFAIGMLCACAVRGRWTARVVWLLVVAFPPVLTHIVTLVPDTLTCAALCLIGAGLLRAPAATRHAEAGLPAGLRGGTLVAWSALLLLAGVVLVALRMNALAVVPVVLALGAWLLRPRLLLASLALGLVLGTLVLAKLPAWRNLTPINVPAASLMWEHAGMLRLAQSAGVRDAHHIDAIAKAGLSREEALDRLLRVHEWRTHDSLIWVEDSPIDFAKATDPSASPVARMHRGLALAHPTLYLRMKWQVARTLLGLRAIERPAGTPIALPRFDVPAFLPGPWHPEWTAPVGVDLSPRGPLRDWGTGLDAWLKAREGWWLLPALPWAGLVVTLLATLLHLRRWREAPELFALPALALGYYATFFVLAPGMHWRYYFPAFVLLAVFVAAVLTLALRPREQTPRRVG